LKKKEHCQKQRRNDELLVKKKLAKLKANRGIFKTANRQEEKKPMAAPPCSKKNALGADVSIFLRT